MLTHPVPVIALSTWHICNLFNLYYIVSGGYHITCLFRCGNRPREAPQLLSVTQLVPNSAGIGARVVLPLITVLGYFCDTECVGRTLKEDTVQPSECSLTCFWW